MPRAFSEDERQAIKQRLLDVGEEHWGKHRMLFRFRGA